MGYILVFQNPNADVTDLYDVVKKEVLSIFRIGKNPPRFLREAKRIFIIFTYKEKLIEEH